MEPVEEERRRGYEMRVPPVMDGAEDDGEYSVDSMYKRSLCSTIFSMHNATIESGY